MAGGRDIQVIDTLRAPMLAEDWVAWADAWRAIDAGPIAELHETMTSDPGGSLILCGERFAQRFDALPRSPWQRLSGVFKSVAPHTVLESL